LQGRFYWNKREEKDFRKALEFYDQAIALDRHYVLAYAEALAILKELQGKYEKREALAQDLAVIYVGLGEKDQAFAWLEKGFQDRSGQLGRTRWEPAFESLRSDQRFSALLQRMGLKT